MNTTDEQTMTLKWRVVVPIVISLLLGSNAFTAYQYQIKENEQEIKYNQERSDRKDRALLEEVKQLIYIGELEEKVREKDKEIKKYEKGN